MLKKTSILKRTILISLLTIMIAAASGWTAIVSVYPSLSQVNVGDEVFVDLIATELNGSGISVFNLTLNFEPSVLQFVDFVVNEELGELLYSDIFTSNADGEITFDVCSNSDPLYLSELQKDANRVTLGKITFKGLQVGESNLAFSIKDYTVLGDFDGNDYQSVMYESALISSVPEPSTAMLTLFCLSVIFSLRLRRIKKN